MVELIDHRAPRDGRMSRTSGWNPNTGRAVAAPPEACHAPLPFVGLSKSCRWVPRNVGTVSLRRLKVGNGYAYPLRAKVSKG